MILVANWQVHGAINRQDAQRSSVSAKLFAGVAPNLWTDAVILSKLA